MIKVYRKTATIKAEQFDGSNEMIDKYHIRIDEAYMVPFRIEALEGWIGVEVGDWIATGVHGEHWIIADAVFKQTYTELPVIPVDERVEEKKYYIKIFDGDFGYLNINNFIGDISVNDVSEGNGYKTKFTDKEIEQLKQRDDIPLDWKKVILEDTEQILNKERGKNYEF